MQDIPYTKWALKIYIKQIDSIKSFSGTKMTILYAEKKSHSIYYIDSLQLQFYSVIYTLDLFK